MVGSYASPVAVSTIPARPRAAATASVDALVALSATSPYARCIAAFAGGNYLPLILNDFVVNLKTAQALGITFPNEILLQVTEVIE